MILPNTSQSPASVSSDWVLWFLYSHYELSRWVVYPMLPFMVRHFHPFSSWAEVGYTAGYIGAAFALGTLIGNWVSAKLSSAVGGGAYLVLLGGLVGAGEWRRS